MTVHYHARNSTVAHVIDAEAARAMRDSEQASAKCLRCGERVQDEGSWWTWGELWEGVRLCEEAKSDD